MRVACEITEVELDGDHGLIARCTRCDHETEAFGTTGRSARRCLVLMREECPMGETNFYTAEEAEYLD